MKGKFGPIDAYVTAMAVLPTRAIGRPQRPGRRSRGVDRPRRQRLNPRTTTRPGRDNALHTIVRARMRFGERIRACIDRRTKGGLSKKNIMCCFKRLVAREVYHAVTSTPAGQITITTPFQLRDSCRSILRTETR
ncbi:hypothetical protein [Streptomyces mobaraensis]|uniref:IS110 family transposase n=1 Tax=Streptomyces mobaraensis TaxID=35621 RepID=A0A5N5W1D1_STRMB|nr:hypothetical protein [Streptomyces mobaraensis]KAB7835707.1 hypothetical protein FRZ00_26150 [Streptomyces mobaraensis]